VHKVLLYNSVSTPTNYYSPAHYWPINTPRNIINNNILLFSKTKKATVCRRGLSTRLQKFFRAQYYDEILNTIDWEILKIILSF